MTGLNLWIKVEVSEELQVMKQCPYCRAVIQDKAIKCKNCLRLLPLKHRLISYVRRINTPVILAFLALIILVNIVFIILPGGSVSGSHPYSVLVTKFRNYVEAIKVKERLDHLQDEVAFVLRLKSKEEGIWNEVHVGAKKTRAEAVQVRNRLTASRIPTDGVRDYKKYKDKVVTKKEIKKIEAAVDSYTEPERHTPDLGQNMGKLMAMFPTAGNYSVEKLYLIDAEADLKNRELCEELLETSLPDSNLPLGINKTLLNRHAKRYGCALYQDNLFRSQAWVIVAQPQEKFTDNRTALYEAIHTMLSQSVSEFSPSQTEVSKVLMSMTFTGDLFELKYSELRMEHIYLLEDQDFQYVYFVWLQGFTPAEGDAFLESIDMRQGLYAFDEVLNHVFVLPYIKVKNDTFYFYNLNRLTSGYAAEKDHARWAEEMVGHWNATAYYDAEEGVVLYSYFDLNLKSQAQRIYDDLYLGGKNRMPLAKTSDVTVHGLHGIYLTYSENYNRSEINFRAGKYVLAVDGFVTKSAALSDLVERANALQF